MKELLEALAKPLTEFPQDLTINETVNGDDILLELHVNKSDMGKVIGKQGRIAKAIRTVMKAAAVKNGKRVTVEIRED